MILLGAMSFHLYYLILVAPLPISSTIFQKRVKYILGVIRCQSKISSSRFPGKFNNLLLDSSNTVAKAITCDVIMLGSLTFGTKSSSLFFIFFKSSILLKTGTLRRIDSKGRGGNGDQYIFFSDTRHISRSNSGNCSLMFFLFLSLNYFVGL